jgi:hypothetical protein
MTSHQHWHAKAGAHIQISDQKELVYFSQVFLAKTE